MIRRILAGMGANSFGMVITIGIQLASLPLFLYFWDTSTYGVWLMLSAIPAYLSMADVGMVTAAGNKMTMAMGRGDVTEANRIFQSAQKFMLGMCSLIAIVALPCILLIPFEGVTNTSSRYALASLCVGVLFGLFGGLSEAAFKATGRYAMGTAIGHLVRLFEWLGFMLGLAVFGSFAGVALTGLVIRMLGTGLAMLVAKTGNDGLHWGFGQADAAEIKATLKPALTFMAFPLANAISLQGITLLVGATLGPIAVAVLNTYRTIARVAVQVTGVMSHALWPEFSRLYGQNSWQQLSTIFKRSAAVGLVQAVLLSVVLYFSAPALLRAWSHGNIEFNSVFMAIMLTYAAVGGLWHVPRILLMATNQHTGMAYWSIAASVIAVVFAYYLGNVYALEGIGLSMLISELFIAVIATGFAISVFGSGNGNQFTK